MTDIFSFIYEPKHKEVEPLPLYIELNVPPPDYKAPPSKDESYERGVIIIQL